jgi:copper chaperone NosL
MTLKSKILMALAAMMLGALYFMPFWTINMSAPQYPEGIGMYIHIDDVTGHRKHDLKSINALNHYIGMSEIHKEDFPEFEIMPWIIGGMIVLGLIAAASGSMKLVIAWITLLILLGIAGFVDFYMWGYDYGHNLNPDAAIKVPGMTYQPPLIGCKQLLNINACSWPHTGFIFIGLSMVFAGAVVWIEKFNKEK